MKSRFRSILLFVADVVVNLAVIVVLVVIIRTFIFSPFQVHGPSMCDTFNNFEGRCIRGNGEYLLINKWGYQNVFGWQVGLPERGDVVVFRPPHGEPGEYYIKRIIGVPGETVEIRNGYVYIVNEENPEGFKLDESEYLNPLNLGHTESPQRQRFEVEESQYFVMGDNRKASSDSRRCFEQTGCEGDAVATVGLNRIEGKAWVVLWPFDRMRVVKAMAYDEVSP